MAAPTSRVEEDDDEVLHHVEREQEQVETNARALKLQIPANIPLVIAGMKNAAATSTQLIPESNGNTSSSLSERNTEALALINDQLRENFSNIRLPSK